MLQKISRSSHNFPLSAERGQRDGLILPSPVSCREFDFPRRFYAPKLNEMRRIRCQKMRNFMENKSFFKGEAPRFDPEPEIENFDKVFGVSLPSPFPPDKSLIDKYNKCLWTNIVSSVLQQALCISVDIFPRGFFDLCALCALFIYFLRPQSFTNNKKLRAVKCKENK